MNQADVCVAYSVEFEWTFSDRPISNILKPDTEPIEGNEYNLTCETDARPAEIISYQWRLNGSVVEGSDRMLSMVLNCAQHEGDYTCSAVNEAGMGQPSSGMWVEVWRKYSCSVVLFRYQ